MARDLITFHYRAGRRFAHLSDVIRRHPGDFAKLAHFGLIEAHPEHAGYWRVTDAGVAYIRGELKVPRHALLFDRRLLKLDGEPRGITEALGRRFNLEELLADVEPTITGEPLDHA